MTAQTLHLSLEEGRVAARQAVLAGELQLAREFALALIQANPDDRAALIVLAAVEPQLGAARDGRRAGARAYRLSQSDGARYEAARLTALAAANEERYTLSQIWLRRAAIVAPDERSRAQTQTDYRGVRRLNPWTIDLGFAITPSNNVNGGSETAYNIIDGVPLVGILSGDAQALPGITMSGDLRFSYAIDRSPTSETTLRTRLYSRSVWLSDEARDISPTSSNSDFSSQLLEFDISNRRRLGDGILSSQALVGWSWFGGDLSTQYNRASLSYATELGERFSGTVRGEVQQSNLQGSFERTNIKSTVAVGLAYRTPENDRVSAQLSFGTQSSDNVNERYETLTAQVSYGFAEPIGPAQISLSGGVSFSDYRDYTVFIPVPNGRQDTRVFASATAVFQDLEYAGFVPVVTFGFQDTQSNVSRFQRDEYSMNIGFRSSF